MVQTYDPVFNAQRQAFTQAIMQRDIMIMMGVSPHQMIKYIGEETKGCTDLGKGNV
jgi:hypothetical protein